MPARRPYQLQQLPPRQLPLRQLPPRYPAGSKREPRNSRKIRSSGKELRDRLLPPQEQGRAGRLPTLPRRFRPALQPYHKQPYHKQPRNKQPRNKQPRNRQELHAGGGQPRGPIVHCLFPTPRLDPQVVKEHFSNQFAREQTTSQPTYPARLIENARSICTVVRPASNAHRLS